MLNETANISQDRTKNLRCDAMRKAETQLGDGECDKGNWNVQDDILLFFSTSKRHTMH